MRNILLIPMIAFALFVGEAKAQSDTSAHPFAISYSVSEAPAWTDLFYRNSGWIGADGIYSIPLNGKDNPGSTKASKSLFIFSDTIFGEIEGDSLSSGVHMINNSFAVLDGYLPQKKKMTFYENSTSDSQEKSVIIPDSQIAGKGEYYWLGDGFVNPAMNNSVYIFGYRMRNTGAAVFGFEEVGNSLLILPDTGISSFNEVRQLNTPFLLKDSVDGSTGSFGAAILANTKEAGAVNPDGYVYVYGVKGKEKELMVGRIKADQIEVFNKWRFWDGTDWNSEIEKAATLTHGVSNELSVTALPDGRYALIFQVNGIGKEVGMKIGLSPVGPFGPLHKLWDCPEVVGNENYYVYNAKAHPHLSEPGELLISYNVNSFEFFNDLKKEPRLYRPRFIKLKFK